MTTTAASSSTTPAVLRGTATTSTASSIAGLRAAVAGLVGFAAAQEQVLLAADGETGPGNPDCWAAMPLVVHNTEFRRQQVQRLRAIRVGQQPPEFAEADHRSAALYAELAAQPADVAGPDSWRVTGELLDEVRQADAADLTDPSRHPWLRGRQLWLQIIVRGFWHPTGHLGEYFLRHGQADRAVALAEHAVATAVALDAPQPARGMANYNLACALAGAGQPGRAAAAAVQAISDNGDLRANVARDPDLAAVRDRSELATVLAD